jgi:hypothetical protein
VATMKLELFETDGNKPISEWITRKLKDFFFESGLEVQIFIEPSQECGAAKTSAEVGSQCKSIK